jgi:hypothetical protein
VRRSLITSNGAMPVTECSETRHGRLIMRVPCQFKIAMRPSYQLCSRGGVLLLEVPVQLLEKNGHLACPNPASETEDDVVPGPPLHGLRRNRGGPKSAGGRWCDSRRVRRFPGGGDGGGRRGGAASLAPAAAARNTRKRHPGIGCNIFK